MSVRTAWLRALVVAACLVAACTPTTAPSSTVPPTESPAAEAGNLPPGCEPINLRSPAGEAVDLEGIWIQDEKEGRQPSTWWIRAFGDCVWGAGTYDVYTDDAFLARADSVQALQGRLGTDFVIDGTIVLLGPYPDFAVPQSFAEVRLLIEFDEAGEITLREDRVPGLQGPRCPDPVGYCPPPLLLRPDR
ncbi:MAG: hypothetical protein AABM41_03860 [Chloroflexota bacterium]